VAAIDSRREEMKGEGVWHSVWRSSWGGPVRHGTKEAGARRSVGHTSDGGWWQSMISETGEDAVGGLVGASVRGLARWEKEVGPAQLRFQLEFCQI
jgi:hypothetical protein